MVHEACIIFHSRASTWTTCTVSHDTVITKPTRVCYGLCGAVRRCPPKSCSNRVQLQEHAPAICMVPAAGFNDKAMQCNRSPKSCLCLMSCVVFCSQVWPADVLTASHSDLSADCWAVPCWTLLLLLLPLACCRLLLLWRTMRLLATLSWIR
jgi:hypothetical protein